MEYEIHPAAEIFPLMNDAEFAGLVADIREYGLLEPLILHEKKILDGRNRYQACQKLGIEPRFEDWPNGEDPQDYVVSKNLHRRHLNISQKAMVAAKIATRPDGGDMSGDRIRSLPSNQQVADQLKIGRTSVIEAKKVLEGTPEEIVAVETGKVSVSSAAKKIRAREDKDNPPHPEMPTGGGARLAVPNGMTAEQFCRQGLTLESQEMPFDQVISTLGINDNVYRMLRDIVWVADIKDLNSQDTARAEAALKELNENRRVSAPHQLIKPIIERIYGLRGHRSDKAVARRLEDFEHAFGHTIQAMTVADDIEIPHIGIDRAIRAIKELNSAIQHIHALKTKLKGLIE